MNLQDEFFVRDRELEEEKFRLQKIDAGFNIFAIHNNKEYYMGFRHAALIELFISLGQWEVIKKEE